MEQFLADRMLVLNLIMSTGIFYWAAQIYVVPKLKTTAAETVFVPILLFHALRHLGLMFMTPSAVYEGMPDAFATPAGVGDFIAALLAVLALYAVRTNKPYKLGAVWVFNIVGTLDFVNAIAMGAIHNIGPYMGASYWIPAFWVPALLVTHYIVFKKLLIDRTAGHPTK